MPRHIEAEAIDALELLRADHDGVIELFDRFDHGKSTMDSEQKDMLVAHICGQLIVQTAIEEELFYPAVRALRGSALEAVDEALVEHASVKDLIAQLGEMEPEDAFYDAKVTVLGEFVRLHLHKEEHDLFPRVLERAFDLKSLGQSLAARRRELMDELEIPDAGEVVVQPGFDRTGALSVKTS